MLHVVYKGNALIKKLLYILLNTIKKHNFGIFEIGPEKMYQSYMNNISFSWRNGPTKLFKHI